MKKFTLIASIVGVIASILFLVTWIGVCDQNELICSRLLGRLGIDLLIFWPVSLFALLAWFASEKIHRIWTGFSVLCVILYMYIAHDTTEHPGGGLGVVDFDGFTMKALLILYVVMSLLIIGIGLISQKIRAHKVR